MEFKKERIHTIFGNYLISKNVKSISVNVSVFN